MVESGFSGKKDWPQEGQVRGKEEYGMANKDGEGGRVGNRCTLFQTFKFKGGYLSIQEGDRTTLCTCTSA